MGFVITHGWSLCRDRLYILITCPLSGRRQIPSPLLSPLLLLLLIWSKKRISSYKTPKHRLSFHVQFVAGRAPNVIRGCNPDPLAITKADVFQGLNESLVPRSNNNVDMFFCNNADLCNGSRRLAEISTMMILLPASIIFFISFFLKLWYHIYITYDI